MTQKTLNHWSRTDLLALPHRTDWTREATYDSILLLDTRTKHPASGWAFMAIIGVRNGIPLDIVTLTSDDITWAFPPTIPRPGHEHPLPTLRTDCAVRSSAIHIWHPDARFRVDPPLSSITITVLPSPTHPTEKTP